MKTWGLLVLIDEDEKGSTLTSPSPSFFISSILFGRKYSGSRTDLRFNFGSGFMLNFRWTIRFRSTVSYKLILRIRSSWNLKVWAGVSGLDLRLRVSEVCWDSALDLSGRFGLKVWSFRFKYWLFRFQLQVQIISNSRIRLTVWSRFKFHVKNSKIKNADPSLVSLLVTSPTALTRWRLSSTGAAAAGAWGEDETRSCLVREGGQNTV